MKPEDRKLAWAAVIVLAGFALEFGWFLFIGPTDHDPKKGDQPNENASLIDWFFNNDHWMIIGTLVLAGASIFQVVIARQTAKRQLRAYVLVDTGNVYDASKVGLKSVYPNTVLLPQWTNWAASDLVLKNSGQTPASHVVHWAMMGVADAATEHLLVAPAHLEESQASVVGPG